MKVLPELNRIAKGSGLLLGIHSGDGKTRETRELIAELTGGNLWYKVSPDRQRMFFRLMADSREGTQERELFLLMYDQLLDLARLGASSTDAEYAANCRADLEELEGSKTSPPNADDRLFYDFGFLLVRDLKDRLDGLGEEFRERYFAADLEYIRDLAASVGLPLERKPAS